jgi:hypothetical protein
MKRYGFTLLLLMLCSLSAFAQVDKHDVRAGNRKFRKDRFKEAEIDYRKAAVKDSTSLAAQYNLASALYRQQDYAGATQALATVKERPDLPARYHFNTGDAACRQKDWQAAVDAFKAALLLDPGDLEAKENYIYAKKMLENQQGGGGGDQDQDQQQQNQDQDQDQNQNQDQNDQQQNPDQDQDDQQDQQDQQNQEPRISPQQAQQLLRAIQAKERETQDKVNKEKAALLKSRQKEKNW